MTMQGFDEEFMAALERAEEAIPPDPRELLLKEEDLAEVVSPVTNEQGAAIGTPMRRVKGDDDWESYVTLYSTASGQPSTVLRGMAAKKLRQRWPEDTQDVPEALWGKPVFTRKPLRQYTTGKLPCMLNPDHLESSFIKEIGLGHIVCRKHNMPTEFAVRQHMQHKHSDEWQAIQSAEVRRDANRKDRTDEENNALLRALITMIAEGKAAEAATPGEGQVS